MKKAFLFLALSLLSFSAVFSQSNKQLVVLITRANWCPTCRANEGKIRNELVPAYSSSNNIEVVINDITNKRTKARSKPKLEAAGVYELSKKEVATGVIILINPATGQIINRLSVANPLEQIRQSITEAVGKI
ncbi:MAG TPA: hypothetical protein VF939_18760 [Puia sp.]